MIARVTRKPRKKRIVILGGGFGGVYAAMQLEKLLARENAVEDAAREIAGERKRGRGLPG